MLLHLDQLYRSLAFIMVNTIHRAMSLEVHQTLKVFHARLNDVASTNNLQIEGTCWREFQITFYKHNRFYSKHKSWSMNECDEVP